MPKFRKKPVVIEAEQFDGNNYATVGRFIVGVAFECHSREQEIHICTLEGTMKASVGDWIIKGVKGEFYPCKPEIFEATYEPAD